MNWNASPPISWKRGVLKTVRQRAYLISSTAELQNREFEHIQKVFNENNSYAKFVIEKILLQIPEEHNKATNVTDSSNINVDDDNISSMNNVSLTIEKHPLLFIPYRGE